MIDVGIAILLARISVALYWQILEHQFVFDDQAVLESPYLYNRRAGSVGFYSKEAGRTGWRYQLKKLWHDRRRLLFLTYEWDMDRYDLRPKGWHATNIAIHAVNTVLVYAILRQFAAVLPAGLGALVFTAHPLATNAVAPISGRSSTLCAVFYFSAILATLCGYWPMAIPLGLLAWRAKEEAVCLPAILGVILWMRLVQ